MFVEAIETHEAFQCRGLHLRDILETQVVCDERCNLRCVVVREAETAANLFGHARADFDMLVKPNAASGTEGGRESRGFADVVKQDAPSQGGRASGAQPVDHDERVRPHIAFRMELRRLFDALHARDLGKKLWQQTRLVEEFKTAARAAFDEDFGELIAKALGGNFMDIRSGFQNRGESGRFDRVPKPRGEAYGSDHAELVLAKPVRRTAYGANDSGAEIVAPADEIEDLLRFGIEEQRVIVKSRRLASS